MSDIPIVDFGKCGIGVSSVELKDSVKIGKDIYKAFATVGFVYLKNTGISQEEIGRINHLVGDFFNLDFAVKKEYSRTSNNYGYVGIGIESVNPERPGDYKEAFNVSGDAIVDAETKWPDQYVPTFSGELIRFCDTCRKLTLRLLDVLSSGMELKDPGYFQQCHSRINGKDNYTMLRSLYYPPIPKEVEVKPGQVRLGEHSDYGSLTLLFQDDVGGLQVESYDGEFKDALPIPGTVLVNIGDILQFWTDGRLKSTKHRVLMPETSSKMNVIRRSVAYFVHPDNEVMLSGIEYRASNRKHHLKVKPEYDKPVTALEHVTRRLKDSYDES